MRLKLFLLLLAGWLLVCGVFALVSPDFGAGFREGFLDGMNRDLDRIRSAFRSPLLKWLLVISSVYLVSFAPLMWLTARGVVSPRFTARVYLPIWITIGIVLLSLDWLRGK
jgi:hypothetical protein